jgi:hypothetical protein
VPFENEDQIFKILNDDKKPVFAMYYCPGEPLAMFFRKAFLNQAKELDG